MLTGSTSHKPQALVHAKVGYYMSKEIDERKRHLEIIEESHELLKGLVKKKKFTLRIADEPVSSDEVAKTTLPFLKMKIWGATMSLLLVAFRGTLRWGPELWSKCKEVLNSML